MYFYEIGVEKKVIKNQAFLTYASSKKLMTGSIVRISVGRTFSNGIVFKQVKKPVYKTKEIEAVISEESAIPSELLSTASWMFKYYASDMPEIINLLLPRGAEKTRRQVQEKKHSKQFHQETELTKDQASAIKQINVADNKTAILHGVTGSGKTRVYVELVKQATEQNKGALILVPEIGLTTQLVSEFKAVFDNIFIVHSHLTESQRHQTWLDISTAEKPIVIGARSALFSPIHKLGVIIIDEEHETSYKQDKNPRYHAVRVASVLASHHKCRLILGSATPSIEDYYLASERGAKIIKMDKTINEDAHADTEIIDLREKSNRHPSSHILSSPLVEAISSALSKDEQVLLFHNRRGTATSVICENCGWLAECPNCKLPLTHHGDKHQLICHVCNYSTKSPFSCPVCKKPELNYKGFGTKQIVEEVNKLFPQSNVARFDSDLSAKDQLEKRYQELRSGEVDIIVGTQIVAKGLDLPKLNVVGIILADSSLYLPDFSANERTFQLLQQVSGRVGRHSSTSKILIQTYSPEHPAIIAAANRDYDTFYASELAQRKLINYPPFCFLLSLYVERKQTRGAQNAADELALHIKQNIKGVEVLGPTPAFRERTPNGYRWQIVIKAKDRSKLIDIINNQLPDRWHYDIDPVNLL